MKRKEKSLPSIKNLFTESFHALRKVFVPFLTFYVLVVAASIAGIIMLGLGVLLLGIGTGLSVVLADGFNPFLFGGSTFLIFLAFLVLIALITSVAQIGSVIILYENDPRIKVFSVVKRSARFIIPILLAGFATGFLLVGGFFLLIIPAIIFYIFFSFYSIVIIAEKKGPIESIKRSVHLILSDFGGVIIRLLALWGVLLGINILGALFIKNAGSGSQGVLSLVNFAVQILASWYSISYSVTLYKHLSKIDKSGLSSLRIFVMISLIGWILAIFTGYMIINTVLRFASQIDTKRNGDQAQTPEKVKLMKNIHEDKLEYTNPEEKSPY